MNAKMDFCRVCQVQALIPTGLPENIGCLCYYCLRTLAHYQGFVDFADGTPMNLREANRFGDVATEDYRLGWQEASLMRAAGPFGAVLRTPAFLEMIEVRHRADRRRREYVGIRAMKGVA